jgi:ABC-2 type transport system permease protein
MTINQQWIAFITILNKEITRFLRIWTQTLLPPVITQSLYFLIFGGFVGKAIKIGNLEYMAFLVPGLVMMAVIASSFANVVSSFFGSKFQKNIEELLVSPTPNWIIINGYVAGGVIRGVLVGLIVYLVSTFFVSPSIQNPLWVIIFVLLTAIIFALGGLLNSIFAKRFDDTVIFQTFILTPLTYFGGVFYLIKDLPGIWQNLSKINPILYMINGFRYGFFGAEFSDINVYASLFLLLFLGVTLYGVCWWLLNKGYGLKN